MKKKALVLIIFAVLFLRTALTAAEQIKGLREDDGNDWRTFKENRWDAAYLVGFLSAEELILSDILFHEVLGNKDLSSETLKIFGGILKRFDLSEISIGQIVDGLNKFYEDFSNRKIKIVDAIYIVKMQIKGENPDLINTQIRYLKMQPIINPPFLLEILNILKKSAEDPKFNIKKEYLDTGKFTKDDFLKAGVFIDEAGKFYSLFCYGLYK